MTMLTENPWPLSIAFAALAMICFVVLAITGRGKYLVFGGVCLLLIGVVVLVEQSIVTPAEVVETQARLLVERVKAGDASGTLEMISPQNQTLRLAAAAGIKMVTVHEDVHLSDLQVTTSAQDSRAMSHFRVNGTFTAMGASQYYPTRWEVNWQKTQDGWQITEVRRLNPMSGESMGILQK